jgi:DNA-binding IclR family transcriptional regulator
MGESVRVQEMALVTLAENGQTSIIAQAQPGRLTRMGTEAHRVFPLHSTGVGKVLLAYQPEGVLAPYLAAPDLPRYTAQTITSSTRLRQELFRIRARGYAIDNEEQEVGVYSLAVPVRDSYGRVIAALGISGPKRRLTPQFLQTSLMEMLRISTLIGPLLSR